MKKIRFSKASAGLLVAVVGFMVLPLQAQDAAPSSGMVGDAGSGSVNEHEHLAFLTQAQRDQLKTARDAALTANPDLSTQDVALKAQGKTLHDNMNASEADKQAFQDAKKPFEADLRVAELKIDPTLQPIFDKDAVSAN